MKGPVRHLADLRLLPRDGSFVLKDHLAGPGGKIGGRAHYWRQVGLIRRVGYVVNNGSRRAAVWELTERARRLLG